MQCKKGIKTILIILCMIMLLSAVGCHRSEEGAQSSEVFFRENSVTVEKYETYTLELQGAEGKQIEWKTNDEAVATVQDGVICGWKKGNTQILACVDGVEVSCSVIVTDNQYVPVIELRQTDELALDVGGTYSLKPVLFYNAREYTDVQYTYSCSGNAVTVDETGKITAVEPGEALVSVQGKWRGNAVEASLTIYVIDVSTSVEVSGKEFNIYLNGKDEEFPASADLGISIFDKDTPVQAEDASVKYIELIREGDVEGAAIVKDGVVYANKIGTTHFVAEYTSLAGETVRTVVFTVNVHKSPADIYMEPIAGEEYASFITPMNPINSVKWDEESGAFHLTNLVEAEDDGRAFIFSRDYIEKILQYTNAKSIVFEVKSDGIASGCPAPDEVIYQGFYPEWYDANFYTRIDQCGEWTKVEVFFDKIPLDAEGNRKSIMLLSTKEGMYIRNIRPMTEGLFLTMDLEMTTLGGNWNKDIEIGLYPHSYKGDINGYNNRVTVKAGVKTTVKVRLDDFLKGGKVPGFGLVVYGGPAWDAKLPDGYTPDRHTLKISNLRVTGERNYSLDLSTASWATGKNGTGFTNANGSGIPSYDDGVITITNGFLYDGHKFTLDSEEAKNRTYIYMDMELTTLGNSTDPVEVRFYAHNFEGNVHESFTDKLVVTAGKKSTVKLDLANYLIDDQFPGIGFAVFGGPAWDAKLPDGYTPDRHTVTISNMRLEGKLEQAVDLSGASVVTGFAGSNSGGTAAVIDGTVVASGGFCYDGHMITFGENTDPEGTEPEDTEPPVEEEETYLTMDMLLTTLSNSTDSVEVRLFNYNYEASIGDGFTDQLTITAGTTTKIKVKADNYLIDGKLPGFGFAIMGGPEWNTQLANGTYDRHSVVVSNIRLEGAQEQSYDLNSATVATGTNGTGFAWANSGGIASIVDGEIVVTGGFRYDAHEVTLPEAQEPPVEEEETYLTMDMLLTTLSNSTDSVEVRLFNYNYEASIGDGFTDQLTITAGTTTKIKVKADNYLIDGKLPGFGFAIMGGPEWNTQLANGTYDRHSVVVSNIRLEGAQEQSYDLNSATVATGTNGTGFAWANSGGIASIVDGEIVVTGGFRYDAHEVTLPEAQEPPVEEEETYLNIDMLLTTLGNSNSPVELRFYPYNFEGSVHNNFTDKITVTAGEQTTVKLELEKYLVDGELLGIGFAIFGGPAWDAKLPDGYTPDRHTVTISGIYLEGGQSTVYDLSKSVWNGGNNGTGYTDANGSGVAEIGSSIVITNGFCYDAHKISLTEKTDSGETEQETYVVLDMQIDTLGGNWTNDIEMRFYAYNFEGNPHEVYTDKVIFKAGEKQTVKLDAAKYLVDGQLTGIGIGIFGGPAWDAKLPDGYTPDRHTVTISSVKLEGEQSKIYDLSKSVCISGTGDTGYTVANGSGVAAFADGALKITNGFCYDCHKISLVEAQEPSAEEENTYLSMDILVTTLSNSTDPVDVCFYPHGFTGNIFEEYTEKLTVTAGTKTTVRIELSKYLVDGELPGIGFTIFGGPEWNTQISPGVYDRHTVTVSNMRLEGKSEQTIDLRDATITTGFANANSGGTAAVVDGNIVSNGGYRYDGHMITFATRESRGILRLKNWLSIVFSENEA